jgi:hypothetical protein
MAFIESQQNPGIVQEIDPLHRAGRVSIRPLDHTTLQGKILGHYRAYANGFVGVINANVIMANFRWTDPTNFAIITRIWAGVSVVTAVTAQRIDPMSFSIARGYSANDGTGATAATISGNNQKNRTNMGSSLVTNIGILSAATGLTGGTSTKDANPEGMLVLPGIGALGTATSGDLYKWDKNGEYPLVLANSEGILINWGATTIATGTVVPSIGFEWAEVAAF